MAKNDSDTTHVWEDFDVTPVIKGVVENDDPNIGFILKFDDYEEGYGVYYYSSEHIDAALRPKLTVTYALDDDEPPTVEVTTPKTGTVWTENSLHSVRWKATDNNVIASTALYFSSDNGATWSLVDSLIGYKQFYSWTIPNTISSECKIKVFAYDVDNNVGSDESDLFTIDAATGIQNVVSEVSNAILLKRNAGTYLVHIPFHEKSVVTISDSRGRTLYSFSADAGNQWYTVPKRLSRGVHIITVETSNDMFVKKFNLIH